MCSLCFYVDANKSLGETVQSKWKRTVLQAGRQKRKRHYNITRLQQARFKIKRHWHPVFFNLTLTVQLRPHLMVIT